MQRQKGLALAVSAYLLITVYGVGFVKIGRVVLPHVVHVGDFVRGHWVALLVLLLVNPVLEEWFWRLFQPKTFQQEY